jgi:hypothetical protein
VFADWRKGRDAEHSVQVGIAERLNGATSCQNGYLLIAERDPSSYRIFLAIYAVIGAILIGAVTLLWRRFRPSER